MGKKKITGDEFANKVDKSAFTIEQAPELKAQAKDLGAQANDINYDWSAVDASLGNLQGVQEAQSKRATEDLTADYYARRQTGPTEAPRTVADLGKLMVANARSQSAAQIAKARDEQARTESEKARVLNNTIYGARMRMQQQSLALENQKFQIQQTLKNTVQSMDLAQQQMLQNYYLTKAQVKNRADSINIDARQKNIDQAFSFAQAGVGAAAAATAAGAAYSAQPAKANAETTIAVKGPTTA